MKKSDVDVKLLMFDPFDPKTVSRLEEYDEFTEDFGIDKSKIIAYIILLYDMNSQLRKEFPHFNKRKLVASELAGFEKVGDKLKEKYEKVILGSNEKVNKAISKYIRLFGSSKYISLVYYWSILSAEYDNVAVNKDSSDYKSTIGNIAMLENKINECVEYLFGGDEMKSIQSALYEAVEKENLRLPRPEVIASADDIDDIIGVGPYNGYKPSPLKYKSHK
jgi:hypothetical protein